MMQKLLPEFIYNDEQLIRPLSEELDDLSHLHSPYLKKLASKQQLLHYHLSPLDAALGGSFELHLILEGRKVIDSHVSIGFLHQGIEKEIEQIPYSALREKLARLSPHNPIVLELAAEIALRALYIQKVPSLTKNESLWLSCSRIHHHVHYIHHLLHWCNIPSLQRHLSQARGLAKTMIQTRQNVQNALKALLKILVPIHDKLLQTPAILDRFSQIGIISQEHAISYGVQGPALKACLRGKGDVYGRYHSHVIELFQSLEEISNAEDLGNLTFQSDFPTPLEPRRVFVQIDSMQGPLFLSLQHQKGTQAERFHLRSPCFHLAAALPAFLKGADLSDVTLIIQSLSINWLEVDR